VQFSARTVLALGLLPTMLRPGWFIKYALRDVTSARDAA
jgi:hypothetical protein